MAKHFSKLKSNIRQFVGNQRCKMMAGALMVMAVMLLVMVGTTAEAEAQNKPEIVYLTNCGTPGKGFSSSEMDYYSNFQKSQNGENPEAIAPLSEGNPVTWEGQIQTGTFPDGNFFRSDITDHNGPDFSIKGTGANKFRSFVCRQDRNGRLLYSRASGGSCLSIYYCQ